MIFAQRAYVMLLPVYGTHRARRLYLSEVSRNLRTEKHQFPLPWCKEKLVVESLEIDSTWGWFSPSKR